MSLSGRPIAIPGQLDFAVLLALALLALALLEVAAAAEAQWFVDPRRTAAEVVDPLAGRQVMSLFGWYVATKEWESDVGVKFGSLVMTITRCACRSVS